MSIYIGGPHQGTAMEQAPTYTPDSKVKIFKIVKYNKMKILRNPAREKAIFIKRTVPLY